MNLKIENAKIITPKGILENHALILKDGFIEAIIPSDDLFEVQDVVDAKGAYLAPGLIDIHMHGNSGYDVMDATNEALHNIAKHHIQNGVTGFLATIMTDSSIAMNRAIENCVGFYNLHTSDLVLSSMLGIYLEGPFFNASKSGAQPKPHIKLPDEVLLREFLDASEKLIKVVSFAPELEKADSLIDLLNEKGVVAAIGHTAATYAETLSAIDKGVTLATHMFNGMKGFSHRKPGTLGAVLLDNRVQSELIVDHVHLHPAAVDLALKTKGPEKIILISDAMRATGLEDGTYDLAGQKVFVQKHEARLSSGALAGSTLELIDAVRTLINKHEVPIHLAFNMASLNPVKALKMEQALGSIEPGKKADFLILNETLDIVSVFKSGVKVNTEH